MWDFEARLLAETDYQEQQEYSLELEWEGHLLDAWEALQPVDDEPLEDDSQSDEPF